MLFDLVSKDKFVSRSLSENKIDVFGRFKRLYKMSSIRLHFFLQDPNTPLTYQFHYKTDNGLYTVVSYGSEDHVTTVLPSGRKKDNYGIDFEITVIDSLSAATKILRKVKVRKIFPRGSLTMLAIASLSSSRFLSYNVHHI